MTAHNLFNYKSTGEAVNKSMITNITTCVRVIELFAGVGGFRIGLERASSQDRQFKIVWSNQWEPSTKIQHASEVYMARFGFENHSNEDISKVKVEDIPEHDLLVGGFPCQDYSVASSLKNAHGIIGKKGVLWWEIYRILLEKKYKAPKYLILENVDRLLKSPASQRGRDFAIILSSLNSLGYAVEWRVIDASEYGMPQRRKRVFMIAYKQGTKLYNIVKQNSPDDIFSKVGLFAKAFPVNNIEKNSIKDCDISDDLVEITKNFNKNNIFPFFEAGYIVDGKCYTTKIKSNYIGGYTVLGDILEDEKNIPNEFYVDDNELTKWQYQKGSKSFERVNKTTGHTYRYSEGSMSFPDALDKPARTIITGEGGTSASRFKHIVFVNGRYRRLTPVELERLNMFPDNHTIGVSDTKRAFLMGNALVIGIVEKLGETLLKEIY
jgi:DNA (cytosine-5)-methyltransferase 1